MAQGLQEFTIIVLAAGLGTRLRPLTNLLPKPALPLGNAPLCLGMITQLIDQGATEIHINCSHLASTLEAEVMASATGSRFQNVKIRFWKELPRLETGGAIIRICNEIAKERGADVKDAFVVSGDIVGEIPTQQMLSRWKSRQTSELALMVTQTLHEDRADVTWVNAQSNTVAGFGADVEPNSGLVKRLFSNYQIIAGEALQGLPTTFGSSVNLIFRRLLAKKHLIINHTPEQELQWHNVGTPRELNLCAKALDLKTTAPTQELINHLENEEGKDCLVVIKKEKGAAQLGAPCLISGFLGSFTELSQLSVVEHLRTLPHHFSVAEGEEHLVEAALQALVASCLSNDEQANSASSCSVKDFRPSVTTLLILQLPPTFTSRLPQPILVGASHFLEFALSQRGTREEAPSPPPSGEWLGLLLTQRGQQQETPL